MKVSVLKLKVVHIKSEKILKSKVIKIEDFVYQLK